MYSILKEETYSFSARAASSKGTVLLALSFDMIKQLRSLKLELDQSINEAEDYVDT